MESVLHGLKGIFQFMNQPPKPNKDKTEHETSVPNKSGQSLNAQRPSESASASDKALHEKNDKNSTKQEQRDEDDSHSLLERLSDFTNSAFRLARRTTGTSLKVGKAIVKSQDQLKLMLAAGQSLKDLREVAGLTLSDLNDALNLKDKTLLEAVENGTATLSFELILRLAALLARNDPIPFVLKFTRTYNPEIWRILHDWGLGRLPLHYERERLFINIYRSHDSARKLSDEGFEKVLEFTRKAFEMSLHFIAEQESIDISEERRRDSKKTSTKDETNDDSNKSDSTNKTSE